MANSVPSDKLVDLQSNAQTTDSYVNSTALTVTARPTPTDPTGKVIKTLAGISADVELALQRIGVQYSDPITDWTALTEIAAFEAHRYPATTGDLYIPTAPLPFTTGATFDSENWTLLQGVTSVTFDAAVDELQEEIDKLEYRDIPAFDQIKNRMLTGRVDIVGIGDSNQLFGGYGWDNGFQYALSQRFDMYATGLVSGYENGSSGAGVGYGYAFNGAQAASLFTDTGAPAGFDDYLDKGLGGLYPHFYGYLSAGTVSATANTGMTIEGVSGLDPLDVSAELIADLHTATFAAGAGSFEGAVRLNGSPYSQLATTGLVSTNTGTDGIEINSVTVPADPTRTASLALRVTASGVDITAPFAYLWMRWSNPSRTSGFSYHTLDARGGQSLRTMAYDLQQLSDTALGYFLGEARRLQGKSKMVVIAFNSGLNDKNETLASVGPNPTTPGDSAAAYVDNATALINRVTEVWELNGWNTNELYFLAFPSHPISDPLDAELESYRVALEAYMQTVPNSQYVNLADLTTEAEMLSEGWYQSGGADRSHLVIDGYQQLGERIITKLK